MLNSHAVEYVPSLDGMPARAAILERGEAEAVSILSVSDPRYRVADDGSAVPPSVQLRAGFESLRPLPGTREETATLRALYGAAAVTALMGPDASRERVYAMAGKAYDIIHFGTHGVQNSTYPALSGVALSAYDRGGLPIYEFLSQSEIASLGWTPQLVFLSACETTLGHAVSGEGMYGLAREFLATGAEAVVATNWQIDDAAAQIFAEAFFIALRDGQNLSEATRLGQLALIDTPVFSQPHFWAPYVLQTADYSR